MTMGSLFDGAGTMPFAGSLCGIETLWSSEIEKFPLAVTAKRFPRVKQLGDITKIDGSKIEPVDIVTFGSPCQDLSIAGKREGLKGERSGLFMEAIRIIKEMRHETERRADEPIRPRYAVWENVPGAYSSNGGEDFRAVLEELCRVVDPGVHVPRPAGGRWKPAGAIVGEGFSVAWRTLDAQFWGVPQRRRRVWLVADFGGEGAPEILFKREGLRRNFKESRAAWEGTASNVEGSIGRASVWDCRGNSDGRTVATLTGDHQMQVTDNTTIVYAIGNGQTAGAGLHDKVESLNCMHDAQAVITLDRAAFNQGKNAQYDIGISENGIAQTVVAKGPGAVAQCGKKIRRLTPTECARLQGMPDWWCADIPHADTPEYKMWGNGMALPNALYVMEGIAATSGEEEGQ